jgi:hypothetical protein
VCNLLGRAQHNERQVPAHRAGKLRAFGGAGSSFTLLIRISARQEQLVMTAEVDEGGALGGRRCVGPYSGLADFWQPWIPASDSRLGPDWIGFASRVGPPGCPIGDRLV